jgi:hypothetical protein
MVDVYFNATVPCAATADPAIGAQCVLATTANALIPGSVGEGQRAIWEMGSVRVDDGGSDGLAATTTDNTPFLDQGIFIP